VVRVVAKVTVALGVSTFVPKDQFLAPKKSQLSLIRNAFPNAFQAYDEGSIPFTRSINAVKGLAAKNRNDIKGQYGSGVTSGVTNDRFVGQVAGRQCGGERFDAR
jgi:hypothetical protein